MKKFATVTLSLMMALSMSACSGSDEPEETETAVVQEAETETEVEAEADTDTDKMTLWDIDRIDAPELTNTTWSFAGGYIDDAEMTQEEMEESLEQYGGQLDFVFGEDGEAQMVQGGGTMEGTYEYLDDGSVSAVFDYNGGELPYTCLFTEQGDQLILVAIADESGAEGLYFKQN